MLESRPMPESATRLSALVDLRYCTMQAATLENRPFITNCSVSVLEGTVRTKFWVVPDPALGLSAVTDGNPGTVQAPMVCHPPPLLSVSVAAAYRFRAPANEYLNVMAKVTVSVLPDTTAD